MTEKTQKGGAGAMQPAAPPPRGAAGAGLDGVAAQGLGQGPGPALGQGLAQGLAQGQPPGAHGLAAGFTPSVVIALRGDVDSGEALVERLEWRLPEAVSRILFTPPLPLEQALDEGVAAALRPHLPHWGEQMVHIVSDFAHEVPGLSLGGLRVIAAPPIHGMQHATLRIRHAVGDRHLLTNPARRDGPAVRRTLEKEAARALSDLLRPCLDLAAVDPLEGAATAPTRLEWRLRRLAENKEEMEFFAWLLARYVAHGDAHPDPEQEAALEADRGRLLSRLGGPAA